MKTEKRAIGDRGERRARLFLLLRGYRICACNWRHGKGELDIVAETRRDCVFVEVKTRTYSPEALAAAPPPSLAVDAKKQAITRETAAAYLRQFPTHKQPRMDVIEVWLVQRPNKSPRIAKIHHIKAAY